MELIVAIIACYIVAISLDEYCDDDYSLLSYFMHIIVISMLIHFISIIPYLIIPIIVYFIIGYLVSLKIFPDINGIPEYYTHGFHGLRIVLNIMLFYPIIGALYSCKFIKSKIKNRLPIRTPFGEYRKHHNIGEE